MNLPGVLQIALYVLVLFAITRPLGAYMARVFSGERTFLSPVLEPIERVVYRLTGVDPHAEQSWVAYTIAMLLFNLVGGVLLFAIAACCSTLLPFNPQASDGRAARSGVQHRRQLHDEHELAGLLPKSR